MQSIYLDHCYFKLQFYYFVDIEYYLDRCDFLYLQQLLSARYQGIDLVEYMAVRNSKPNDIKQKQKLVEFHYNTYMIAVEFGVNNFNQA